MKDIRLIISVDDCDMTCEDLCEYILQHKKADSSLNAGNISASLGYYPKARRICVDCCDHAREVIEILERTE